MRLLTPEVERVLRTFDLTHRLRQTEAGWSWECIALPESGGALDQTGRVMDEQDFILRLKQSMLADTLRKMARESHAR